jgi:3-mercaptopyruvate sulfurtransferase SseA
MNFGFSFLRALSLSASLLWASASASAGSATAVSADDAQAAVTQGAYVLDVRPAQAYALGHLPQATLLPQDSAQRNLPELAHLLTLAGVDSSRTIVVVGEAGDPHAQALWQRLAQVAPGRVLWLVGGVPEWQMRGYALTTDVMTRLPVPQVLVPFEASEPSTRMAGSKVRSSSLLERNLSIRVAFAQ